MDQAAEVLGEETGRKGIVRVVEAGGGAGGVVQVAGGDHGAGEADAADALLVRVEDLGGDAGQGQTLSLIHISEPTRPY